MGTKRTPFFPPYRRLRQIFEDTPQGTMMCFLEDMRVDTLEQVGAMFEQLRKVHGLLDIALRCAEESCIVAIDAIEGKFSEIVLRDALARQVEMRRKIFEERPSFTAFLEPKEKEDGCATEETHAPGNGPHRGRCDRRGETRT